MKKTLFLLSWFCYVLNVNTVLAETSITFSEFPVGTSISNQYSSEGIIFGGDSPFISHDFANPTTPVLTGTPRFNGDIKGTFVSPDDGTTPVVVPEFTIDAGYFDAIGSVKLEWFDKNGKKIGQRANTLNGIQKFTISGGGIASWNIGIFKDEPAGYAIDNVKFEQIGPSIVFREKKENDGFWWRIPILKDEVPGFDHVGFHLDDLVYESHPGYGAKRYISVDGSEFVNTVQFRGVQAQHVLETFKHYSPTSDTKVVDVEEIPIDRGLATSMKSFISTKILEGASFRGLSFDTLELIQATMLPSPQKGGGDRDGDGKDDNKFTCVGLVEWAAEQAGHNGGQGFIRNEFESFSFPRVVSVLPPEIVMEEVPLLSPQLLNYNMKFSGIVKDIKEWMQGFFDPVDFIITDPVGRRLGYVESIGEINEIPGAFFSGNGFYEQFFIPNPLPGEYRVDLFGVGENVFGAFATADDAQGIEEFMADGEELSRFVQIDPVVGSPGDVNNDGMVDFLDVSVLQLMPRRFVNDLNDPADVNRDGEISYLDVKYLEHILSPILGDLNGDRCVDRQDYNLLVSDVRGPSPHNVYYDINGDGSVNRADIRTLINNFSNRGNACFS